MGKKIIFLILFILHLFGPFALLVNSYSISSSTFYFDSSGYDFSFTPSTSGEYEISFSGKYTSNNLSSEITFTLGTFQSVYSWGYHGGDYYFTHNMYVYLEGGKEHTINVKKTYGLLSANVQGRYYITLHNNTPTISGVTSLDNYINSSNSENITINLNDVNEIDDDQELSLFYSFDGLSYTELLNFSTYKNLTAGEDLETGSIVKIGTGGLLYKTDARYDTEIDYVGVVTSDTLSGSITKIETSGLSYSFTGLTDGATYYLSDEPGEISTTSGINEIEFGTASGSTVMYIKNGYYENVESEFIIDASGEEDGEKIIYVKVNDGISDSSEVLLNIEKDTTPPTLAEVTPIGITNNTTPSYTFSSTETGSLNYSGICETTSSSVFPGDNTITINSLSEGVYDDCNISVTDEKGNTSSLLNISSFTIDTTPPTELNKITAGQDSWNTIRIYGTCESEEGLNFIVEDNGSIVYTEELGSPCVFDYTYNLTNPPLEHDVGYYLQDSAGNKTNTHIIKGYSDSSGYLVTPSTEKQVGNIISFFGYATPNTDVQIKTTSGSIIASGSTDNNGIFSIETFASQQLGELSIDLEVDGIAKNDIRNIEVVNNSLIIPQIVEDSVYSIYSGEKDVHSFESQIISFDAIGEPLSSYRVYSYAEVSGERLITEIAEGSFESDGTSSIVSTIELPGGENEIVIVDTIHNVSSNIIYMVIADPFGTVYDSKTKKGISGVEITFCEEGQTTPAVLPMLHGEPQPNPVTTDFYGNYFSYETVGNKYYICNVEKSGYNFPSTNINSGTPNLDGSENVGSHGQVFEIISTPLRIDIPIDIIESTGGGSSSSNSSGSKEFYKILVANKDEKNITTKNNKQILTKITKGTQTITPTHRLKFNGFIYEDGIYRFMYERLKGSDQREGIDLTKHVNIQITDINFSQIKAYIRYNDSEEFNPFEDYQLKGKTIEFETEKGFEMKIENITLPELFWIRYNMNYYDILDIKKYIKFVKTFEEKYSKKINEISNDKVFENFPIVFDKMKDINSPTKKTKYMYNYLGGLYNMRFNKHELENK